MRNLKIVYKTGLVSALILVALCALALSQAHAIEFKRYEQNKVTVLLGDHDYIEFYGYFIIFSPAHHPYYLRAVINGGDETTILGYIEPDAGNTDRYDVHCPYNNYIFGNWRYDGPGEVVIFGRTGSEDGPIAEIHDTDNDDKSDPDYGHYKLGLNGPDFMAFFDYPLFLPDDPPGDPPAPERIKVHVFYDQKDTIILQDDASNYPEVSFVTLAAIKDDGTGKLSLYDGSDGPIRIKIASKIQEEIKSGLVNLTDQGLELTNVGTGKEVFPDEELDNGVVDWKGFFLALGDGNLETALNSIKVPTDSIFGDPDNLQIEMTQSICVVAVKSWNYNSCNKDSRFALENVVENAGDVSADIVVNERAIKTLRINLNVDNVDFVRDTASGKFVVKGTDMLAQEKRLYNNIVDIKRKEAKKEIGSALPSGSGPDWLQVAAVDIYNNPPNDNAAKVFKCVKKIVAKESIYGGWVNLAMPSVVFLNPYSYYTRYNTERSSAYGFTANKCRTSIIYHEALHSFQLSGEGVYDEDEDGAIVAEKDPKNTQHPLFKFAWDSPKRGRITIKNYCDIPGAGGDEVKGDIRTSYFYDTINYKDVGTGPFGNSPHPLTSVPTDLPYKRFDHGDDYLKPFFCNPDKKTVYDPFNLFGADRLSFSSGYLKEHVGISINEGPVIKTEHGEYVPATFGVYNATYTALDEALKKKCDELNKNGYKLYISTTLTHKEPVFEYDAENFALTHGSY